jgi:hypothetical protein
LRTSGVLWVYGVLAMARLGETGLIPRAVCSMTDEDVVLGGRV